MIGLQQRFDSTNDPQIVSASPVKSTGEVLSGVITLNMIHKEFITLEAGQRDAWICVCGNTPVSDGFFACDEAGNEMEPVSGWKNLYVCNRCGIIIQQDSLEVIGRNLNFKTIT